MRKVLSSKHKYSYIGAILFPSVYLLVLAVTKNPDLIVFVSGPFSIVIWLVQWIGFILGGWLLAAVFTLLLLSVIGYILGWFVKFILLKLNILK